jgi:hypothetical protein
MLYKEYGIISTSAYCRIEIPPSTKWGTRLPICPSSFPLAIRIASISAMILKGINYTIVQ